MGHMGNRNPHPYPDADPAQGKRKAKILPVPGRNVYFFVAKSGTILYDTIDKQ
jgi:hypothetical protein